jgi:hypothetical protein
MQAIGLVTVEPVAVLVPEGLDVVGPGTGSHHSESGREVDRAVGVFQPLVHLAVAVGFLARLHGTEHPVPSGAGKRSDAGFALGALIHHVARHRIAEHGGVLEPRRGHLWGFPSHQCRIVDR